MSKHTHKINITEVEIQEVQERALTAVEAAKSLQNDLNNLLQSAVLLIELAKIRVKQAEDLRGKD